MDIFPEVKETGNTTPSVESKKIPLQVKKKSNGVGCIQGILMSEQKSVKKRYKQKTQTDYIRKFTPLG